MLKNVYYIVKMLTNAQKSSYVHEKRVCIQVVALTIVHLNRLDGNELEKSIPVYHF